MNRRYKFLQNPIEVTHNMMSMMNIPRKFWDANLRSVINNSSGGQEYRKFASRIGEMIESGTGLVILGPPNTGKSYAAVAIAKFIRSCGIGGYWISHDELTEGLLKNVCASTPIESRPEFVKKTVRECVESRPLLVLDNFTIGNDLETKFTTKLLMKRDRDVRSTIITSNLSQKELVDVVGENLSGVISNNYKTILMTGVFRKSET